LAHGDKGIIEIHVFDEEEYTYVVACDYRGENFTRHGTYPGEAKERLDVAARIIVDILKRTPYWNEELKARVENAAYGKKTKGYIKFAELLIEAMDKTTSHNTMKRGSTT
jgi:hypothetical protein